MNTTKPAPRFLDIHVLRSVPFSNLNRDDIGAPKDVTFGGRRRARVSSQSMKRSVREMMQERGWAPAAERTRKLPGRTSGHLVHLGGWDKHDADLFAHAALHSVGVKPYAQVGSSDTLTFLPADAGKVLAEALHSHPATSAVLQEQSALFKENRDAADIAEKDKAEKEKAFKEFTARVGALSKAIQSERTRNGSGKDLAAAVKSVLLSVNPLIALMGRMLASMPDSNVDGAVQVAHAFTTHEVVDESDFFTAVDDLQSAADTGAGFVGVADFVTGVFYYYACVDLGSLESTMEASGGGDRGDAAEIAAAFAAAFALAGPSAKQSSTAPNTRPSVVLVSARADQPVSYANAFERPVAAAKEGGFISPSAARLLAEAEADDREEVAWAVSFVSPHVEDAASPDWAFGLSSLSALKNAVSGRLAPGS